MAEEERSDQQENAGGRRKKLLVLFGVMFLVEAALIVGAMMIIRGPSNVQAAEIVPGMEAEDEKVVEVLVLDERLPNNRQGINYVYDTEIWVHVKKKHEPRVSDELNRFRNELKSEMMAIWRTAEPRHLQEPKMENLTRKVETLLRQRFGDDADSGEAIIDKCVIVSGPPFRVDG